MDFSLSLSVVFPLFVYLALGAGAHKLGYLEESAVNSVNKFAFKFLFSLNMFYNVISARDALGFDSVLIAVEFVSMFFLQLLLLFMLAPLLIKDKKRHSVFIQAGFRGNSILFALPLVSSIYGQEAMGLAAVVVAILVPIYNVAAVLVLGTMSGEKINGRKTARTLVTNPIICGAVVGLLFCFFKIDLPAMVNKPVKALCDMTTPLALVMLGANLRFTSFKNDLGDLIKTMIVRLVLSPMFFVGCCMILGLGKAATTIGFAIGGVPVAVSSYSMAQQMGGDGPFAAEAVALSTVLSLFTVFIWVTVLNSLGII